MAIREKSDRAEASEYSVCRISEIGRFEISERGVPLKDLRKA